MGKSPEELRAEIAATRDSLGTDVDLLTEKVSPGRVVNRKLEGVKRNFGNVKDSIMGSSEHGTHVDPTDAASGKISGAADSVRGAASTVADTASAAPSMLKERAEGNPLAAGLIAFGLGWLASTLIPASQPEQQLASTVKDQAGELVAPVKEQLQQTAQEVKDNLQGPAQEALASVKDKASEAAGTMQEEGKSAAEDLKGQAQSGAHHLRDQAADTTS